MKIAVCIKQVPVVSLLKFDNESRRVVRDGVPSEVNPFDVLGMSLAANLKRQHDAEVVVFTMGPPQARDALVQCLAMGADSAVHLNDRAFAGSDTLATARALALALAQDDYDLIICGRNSVDAETGQVGAEIADMLDLPQVSGVRRLELNPDSDSFALEAERITDEGYDVVRCALPALITVTEDVAPEIYPRRAERQAAQEKPVATLTAADLSDDASVFGADGSPTSVSEIYSIEPEREGIVVRDKPAVEAVSELMAYLDARGALGSAATTAGVSDATSAAVQRGPLRACGDAGAIWVLAEMLGSELRPITLELLGRSCELADTLNTSVEAVLIGAAANDAADESTRHANTLAAYGADRVLLAQDTRLAEYEVSQYTAVLADAIATHRPYAVLLGSTVMGRELAARLAGRLSLGLTGDCIGLEVDDEGRLVQLKPAFGGNIVAPILSNTTPYMATVRPGLLTPVVPDSGIDAVVERLLVDGLGDARVHIIDRVVDESAEGAELDSAHTIISVGKGIGGPENLPLLRELADVLDAPLGATRDVTELGWLPRQYQIGLSGKSVSPRLYFAVALSGVFNHTVGIGKAGTVVAINHTARAPIFRAADFGIVGDYTEVVPALIKALKARGG
ncbi:MAG: electron transfer flavoprotein alpha/ beta subunit [Chloroflexi bacterium]|nr:electron transfer flavoprotein alpha/ beta subunit [Chloroflexota bacterium]